MTPQISSLNKVFIIELNHEPNWLLRFAFLSLYVCWWLGYAWLRKESARKCHSLQANIRYCAGNFILSHLICSKMQVDIIPTLQRRKLRFKIKNSLHTQVCLTPTLKLLSYTQCAAMEFSPWSRKWANGLDHHSNFLCYPPVEPWKLGSRFRVVKTLVAKWNPSSKHLVFVVPRKRLH